MSAGCILQVLHVHHHHHAGQSVDLEDLPRAYTAETTSLPHTRLEYPGLPLLSRIACLLRRPVSAQPMGHDTRDMHQSRRSMDLYRSLGHVYRRSHCYNGVRDLANTSHCSIFKTFLSHGFLLPSTVSTPGAPRHAAAVNID